MPDKTTRILSGALLCFKRYGFNKTSMADIAEASNMSRPALYLVYKNKRDVFRAVSRFVHQGALEAAAAALDSDNSITERIINAMVEIKRPLFELLLDLPHGSELIDVNTEMSADINRQADSDFIALISRALKTEINNNNLQLQSVTPAALAGLLHANAHGIKKFSPDFSVYKKLVRQMVTLMMTGSTKVAQQ